MILFVFLKDHLGCETENILNEEKREKQGDQLEAVTAVWVAEMEW